MSAMHHPGIDKAEKIHLQFLSKKCKRCNKRDIIDHPSGLCLSCRYEKINELKKQIHELEP